MHKLPQPVKLWYLSSFFRQEKPQAGRFRQFWQVGAEAIGSDDPAVDAETILLLGKLLEELEVGGRAPADRQPRHPRAARRLSRAAAGPPARPRGRARPRTSARGSTSTRCARSTPTTRGPRRHGDAPLLLDRLDADDAEHFAAVRELLDAPSVPYEVDPTLVRGLDYYTRTVFEFTSDALGAQSGVGGGGRYDGLVEQLGGPPTPGCGWAAGVERMLLAGGAAPGRAAAGRPVRRVGRPAAARAPRSRRREARRAGLARRWSWPAARSRASSSRPTGSARATLRSSATTGRCSRTWRPASRTTCDGRGRRADPARAGHAMRPPPRANAFRDAWAGDLHRRARRRAGARRGLGAPPPRPRRPDLHRPARPLRHRAARLPPGGRRRGVRRRRAAALRARRQRRGRRRRARAGQRQPEPRRRARSRCSVGEMQRARRGRDAAVPDRRGRSRSTRRSPAPPRARPAPRRHARGAGAAPRGRRADARRARRARLPGDRDADPHALDAGGRARLPRPRAHAARATCTRCRSRRSCSSSC